MLQKKLRQKEAREFRQLIRAHGARISLPDSHKALKIRNRASLAEFVEFLRSVGVEPKVISFDCDCCRGNWWIELGGRTFL